VACAVEVLVPVESAIVSGRTKARLVRPLNWKNREWTHSST
jgi:hypothetical protein